MRPAASVGDLLSAPLGRYFVGGWYLVWVYNPSLIGTVYFGVPDARDFAELERLFELLEHPLLSSHYDVFADASAVDTVPAPAFQFLINYISVARNSARRMRRVSIVRPSGMFGATLAGVFYDNVRQAFAAGLFADRAEAAHWLRHPDAAAACAELDELVDEIRRMPRELRELRSYIELHLTRSTLRDAASALNTSTRSLQRALAEANTSFRAQVEMARMRAAERLLVDGDEKIEVVARAVGFSQLGHFTTAFQRVSGELPSQFRARRTGKG